MNELIEELWRNHSKDIPTGFVDVYGCEQMELMVSRESFAQAIQTACKAQRNACARHTHYKDDYTLSKAVKTAQIEREDYE